MKKSVKGLFAASVIAAAVAAPAHAEVSTNIGVTSNYLWRGWTQSMDEAAVSGGVDYSHASGLYAGTWVSSLGGGTSADVSVVAGAVTATGTATSNGDYELDLYLGYAGEMAGVGYDVGYINYRYPNSESDFSEVYLGASYEMFSAQVSYDSDNKDMYAEVGVDFELAGDLGLGLHAGSYNFDAGTDYSDYSVSLSKGDVTFTISDMSENLVYNGTDNYRVAVSWGQSF